MAALRNACEISTKSLGAWGTACRGHAAREKAGERREEPEEVTQAGGDEEGRRVEEPKLMWDFLVRYTGGRPGAPKGPCGLPSLPSR